MKARDTLFTRRESSGGDENLPPIRSGSHLKGSAKVPDNVEQKKKKKAAPRDYREWDKWVTCDVQ